MKFFIQNFRFELMWCYSKIRDGLLKAKLPWFQSVNQDRVFSALKTLKLHFKQRIFQRKVTRA